MEDQSLIKQASEFASPRNKENSSDSRQGEAPSQVDLENQITKMDKVEGLSEEDNLRLFVTGNSTKLHWNSENNATYLEGRTFLFSFLSQFFLLLSES